MALILALAVATGCAPALDWREVRPPGSGAILNFPCKPGAQQRPVALAGASTPMSLLACSAADLTWGLAFTDVVDPARVGPALRALKTAAAANLGAGAVAAAAAPVAGATPNDDSGQLLLDGRMPDGRPVRMQLLVFVHGTTVFQASLLGPVLPEEAAQVFFGSIRFPP